MPLSTVFTDFVRPKKAQHYRELVQTLAQQAREKKESFHWTAHETIFGATNSFRYVAVAEDFAGIAARGLVDELFTRVLGEDQAIEHLQKSSQCIVSQEVRISMDRPDLSYAPDQSAPGELPWAVVTALRPRPGHQETCEELLRKIAEAIPKVNPDTRMIAYQTVMGDLGRMFAVRPLASLADLDGQLQPQQLLEQAFGVAEGGLLYRSSLEAIESVERETVLYRPEMSNPA